MFQAKELEIQTHCHLSLHIQPTWTRGKQYRYLSGSNVHSIRSAEFADRWVGPNMCHVCGESRETSLWLTCSHSSSRRKQGCTYRVHCHCIGLYYASAIELGQVPFFCQKHGRATRRGTELDYGESSSNRSDMRFVDSNLVDVNGGGSQRQLVERSNAGSVLVRDSNAPMGSELIHVIDSTTGLRSAVRVDSTTASGTEMLLHFHSSIVQSAEMTGDPTNTAVVLEMPNDALPVPETSEANTLELKPESDAADATAKQEESEQGEETIAAQGKRTVLQQIIKTEVDSGSDSQQQFVEVPIGEYNVPESEQVVAVEEVQVEDVVTEGQVVSVEEVQVSEQMTEQEVEMETEYVTVPQESQMILQEGNPVVVDEDGSEIIVQEGAQIIVQPDGTQVIVQPDGTQMIIQQETEIVAAEGSDLTSAGQSMVFVSSANVESHDGGGMVFQMAGESSQQSGEEITVYSQQPAVEHETDNVVPTRLEKMPEAVSETEAANLQAGAEIMHVVDSNTAMVLEVQSDANVEAQ